MTAKVETKQPEAPAHPRSVSAAVRDELRRRKERFLRRPVSGLTSAS